MADSSEPLQNACMIEVENRSWPKALLRGFCKCCPACGHVGLFNSYLGITDACQDCGAALHHQRADDAPPYFTIFVVGHIIVPALLVLEKTSAPPLWVHFVIWLPATLILTLWLLPRMKGATVGLQWAFRMHGFGAEKPETPRLHSSLE